MTFIYDVPYEDIQNFLVANNLVINNRDNVYNKAFFY